jgi:hypothetical protein
MSEIAAAVVHYQYNYDNTYKIAQIKTRKCRPSRLESADSPLIPYLSFSLASSSRSCSCSLCTFCQNSHLPCTLPTSHWERGEQRALFTDQNKPFAFFCAVRFQPGRA